MTQLTFEFPCQNHPKTQYFYLHILTFIRSQWTTVSAFSAFVNVFHTMRRYADLTC